MVREWNVLIRMDFRFFPCLSLGLYQALDQVLINDVIGTKINGFCCCFSPKDLYTFENIQNGAFTAQKMTTGVLGFQLSGAPKAVQGRPWPVIYRRPLVIETDHSYSAVLLTLRANSWNYCSSKQRNVQAVESESWKPITEFDIVKTNSASCWS